MKSAEFMAFTTARPNLDNLAQCLTVRAVRFGGQEFIEFPHKGYFSQPGSGRGLAVEVWFKLRC